MTVFNTEYVAHVYNQRGYYVNEFAARLDLSNDTVEQFLRGTVDPGDLRISTLITMAQLLGIPLHSMFAEPDVAPEPDDIALTPADANGSTALTDAEQLTACLYDTGRSPVLMSEIAKAFGWTMDRLRAAAAEADRRLKPAGLHMSTSHGEITVVPVNDHHAAQQALTRRRVSERGLSFSHYKVVYQVLNGQPVTVHKKGRMRQRTLGGLVNYGAITSIKNPALTGAAAEAFLQPG